MLRWLVFFALLPSWAAAQTTCAPRSMLARALFNIDGSTPVIGGLSSRGKLLEVFISPRRSWVLVETDPGGLSCVVVVGSGMEAAAPIVKVVPKGIPG